LNDTYTLSNDTSFSIAPGWGCNLFSWKVGGIELMYCPEDLPQTAQKITGGGNPLLFPSVGRTWDHSSGKPVAGIYRIFGHDKPYFMPSHGVLFMSEFRKVDERTASDSITAAYETRISEQIREKNYPFDLSLTQSFTLKATSIELESTIINHGDVPAPCAFGYHPYFAISNPERKGVTARIPVAKCLLTTPDTILLTGESEPTEGIFDLQPDIYYDHAYGEPVGSRMALIDRNAGRTINVDFDKKSELFFLYSPDGSDFVCIEPWTRGLGAYESLKEPNWTNGKLIPVLQPGEAMEFKATFSVSPA
jgi:galactose mutarotase-like enzyme